MYTAEIKVGYLRFAITLDPDQKPMTHAREAIPTRYQIVCHAVPVILANIGVSLTGIADTAVMGRMSDPVFLSATAVGATFFSTLYWAFGFLRMSTGGMVAQAYGAGDNTAQRRVVWRALCLAGAIGLVAVMLQGPLLSLGLAAIENEGHLHALIADYAGVRIWSAPAILGLFVLYGALVGRQHMRLLLTLQLVQTGLNVVLNIAFYTFTDLDVRGVALATVIADYTALTLALVYMADVLRGETADWWEWLLDSVALRRLFSLSGHLFVRSLFLTGAYFWMTAAGTQLGVSVVAANAILLLLVTFTAHFLDGFAHAAEALVGQAIGARNQEALNAAIMRSAELSVIVAILMTMVFVIGGGHLIDAMTTEPGVREATRQWLPWAWMLPLAGVGSFLLDGIFIGATDMRSMRDTVAIACIGFVVATWLLLPIWGNHGLWGAYMLMQILRALGLGMQMPKLMRTVLSSP